MDHWYLFSTRMFRVLEQEPFSHRCAFPQTWPRVSTDLRNKTWFKAATCCLSDYNQSKNQTAGVTLPGVILAYRELAWFITLLLFLEKNLKLKPLIHSISHMLGLSCVHSFTYLDKKKYKKWSAMFLHFSTRLPCSCWRILEVHLSVHRHYLDSLNEPDSLCQPLSLYAEAK